MTIKLSLESYSTFVTLVKKGYYFVVDKQVRRVVSTFGIASDVSSLNSVFYFLGGKLSFEALEKYINNCPEKDLRLFESLDDAKRHLKYGQNGANKGIVFDLITEVLNDYTFELPQITEDDVRYNFDSATCFPIAYIDYPRNLFLVSHKKDVYEQVLTTDMSDRYKALNLSSHLLNSVKNDRFISKHLEGSAFNLDFLIDTYYGLSEERGPVSPEDLCTE